jgi:hypothetical protein
MHKSDGDGSLVTQVAAQAEYLDCAHGGEQRGKEGTFAHLYRSIIDQYDLDTIGNRRDGIVYPPD